MTFVQAITIINIFLCIIGTVNAMLLMMYAPRFKTRWWIAVGVIVVYVQYTGLMAEWHLLGRIHLPGYVGIIWAVFHTAVITVLAMQCNIMMRCVKRKGRGNRNADRTGQHRAVQ